uniref:C-type lectin domain-containing protein n=1 Tax=Magallana gigas TaxID=29159 RepID=A0A8W8IRV6_MAGGI|nr:perlucin-like isoform X1 [Crassostrea gigas]
MKISYLLICMVFEILCVSAECPDNWVRHADSCYLFINRYIMEWIDAMTFCETFDAKLAEVETAVEETFLRHEANIYGAGRGSFWIGGSDVMAEGKWKWMTSNTPINYTNWARGSPSNSYGAEHCLCLYYHAQFFWNDESCTTRNPFICEKDANSPALGFLVG